MVLWGCRSTTPSVGRSVQSPPGAYNPNPRRASPRAEVTTGSQRRSNPAGVHPPSRAERTNSERQRRTASRRPDSSRMVACSVRSSSCTAAQLPLSVGSAQSRGIVFLRTHPCRRRWGALNTRTLRHIGSPARGVGDALRQSTAAWQGVSASCAPPVSLAVRTARHRRVVRAGRYGAATGSACADLGAGGACSAHVHALPALSHRPAATPGISAPSSLRPSVPPEGTARCRVAAGWAVRMLFIHRSGEFAPACAEGVVADGVQLDGVRQRLRKEQDAVIKKINKIHSKLCETLDTGAQPATVPPSSDSPSSTAHSSAGRRS